MEEATEYPDLLTVETCAGAALHRPSQPIRGGLQDLTVGSHRTRVGDRLVAPLARRRPSTRWGEGGYSLTSVPDHAYVDIDGPVHIADLGGEGPPVVCVHGLGGSHVNWKAAAPHFRRLGRVTAIDLPGFGLTPPAGRSGSVHANTSVLDRYLRSFNRPVTLVGNSMGGTISLLVAAESPELVSRLVLVSPAVPPAPGAAPDRLVLAMLGAYTMPGMARGLIAARRRHVDPEVVARWTLRLCAARVDRLPPGTLAAHVDLARRRSHLPGIDRAFVEATRSIVWLLGRRSRFDTVIGAVRAPTLVVHGQADRLVRYQSALRVGALRPDWRVEILDGVGHIAMLETPDLFGRLVMEFAGAATAS